MQKMLAIIRGLIKGDVSIQSLGNGHLYVKTERGKEAAHN
jgi:hypothetical protein